MYVPKGVFILPIVLACGLIGSIYGDSYVRVQGHGSFALFFVGVLWSPASVEVQR